MKIKSIDIKAFGKLKDLHISSEGGFNVIFGENGSGKTTVMDFIKSVFYGIGRGRERSLRIPWDGSKASGSISYFKENSGFVCQASFGKTARGDKCEVFSDISGEIIGTYPPGTELFGMSDVTFSKTAFISSGGARIEQKGDDEIAEKLSNLKETGDEGVSFSAASADFDAYLAKLVAKRGRGGRIQQLEDSIEQLKSEIYTAEKISADSMNIRKSLEEAVKRRAFLEKEIQFLKDASEIADYRYCKNIKKQLDELPESLNTEEAECFLQKITRLSEELRSVKERLSELPMLSCEKEKISDDDFARVTEIYYSKNQTNQKAPFIIMVLLVLAFFALGFTNPLFFTGTLIFAVMAVFYRPKADKNMLSEELSKFGESDYESFRTRFMGQEKQESVKQNLEKLEAESERISKLLEAEKTQADRVFGDWKNLNGVIENAKAVRQKQTALSSAFEGALRGRNFDEMEQKYGSMNTEIPDDFAEKLRMTERALSDNLSNITSLERRGGVLEGSGQDITELERRIAELTEKKDGLRFKYDVMSTVLDVLNESYEVMEGEFGEKLNRRAGDILEGISGYNNARMSRDFGVKLSENGEIHDVADFSTGLYEQVYLSFRLAMLEAMDGDCPVFLDDCLMSYDDSRAEKLLSYLNEFSKNRQVFLFTCRKRDYDMALSLGANCIII